MKCYLFDDILSSFCLWLYYKYFIEFVCVLACFECGVWCSLGLTTCQICKNAGVRFFVEKSETAGSQPRLRGVKGTICEHTDELCKVSRRCQKIVLYDRPKPLIFILCVQIFSDFGKLDISLIIFLTISSLMYLLSKSIVFQCVLHVQKRPTQLLMSECGLWACSLVVVVELLLCCVVLCCVCLLCGVILNFIGLLQCHKS